MRVSTMATGLMAGLVAAQRPSNTSICDYYTTALLKNNTAANQLTVLTLVVNTAVIGNYTKPNIPGVTFPDVMVPGILNPKGSINGTSVNLVPYFSGALASTNNGGSMGVSQNFLDGGGAAPLMMNKPADDMTSNQYTLLTHLYQFFGVLLGCSQMGGSVFPAYGGEPSMYSVHKYMDLDYAQVSYFVEQVGLSAASFGVAQSDVADVGMALDMYFNVRCAAPVTLAPALGSQMQSICIAADCPMAANSSCSGYASAVMPSAVSTASGAAGTSPAATGSGSMPQSSVATGAAPTNAAGAMVAVGAAAVAFLL